MNWYLNRLQSMSPLEIPYRAQQVLQKQFEKRFAKGNLPKLEVPVSTKKLLKLDRVVLENYPMIISIFGKQFDFSTGKIDWHKDIFSGESFPLSFSKDINIRKEAKLSAKNVWEINRLQFLPHIALNFKNSRNQKYLDYFIQINTSWINANPYLKGVNWYSNIEVNIRLINWFFAWELLDVEKVIEQDVNFKEFVEKKWLPSIYQHCKFSFKNPSKYSSANNHLISEYSGLYVASKKWKFPESLKWSTYAKLGLEKEIVKQHSNGVNKEEAAEYIQFITDFFLIPYVIGENIDDSFSEGYKDSLQAIFEYIYEFTDIKGNFPKYGDEDDGKVVFFSNDPHYNNFKSLCSSAAILFQDAKYIKKSAGFDLKNQILFGQKGKAVYKALKFEKNEQSSKFYSREGHFIFRKQKDGKEIYAHFDAAPLGYLSIAAHGHSDALAFLLHINGNPIFIDPGTYSYHVSKEWRSYFVSSKAHNTITFDDRNQAFHAADTMWLNHYKCEMLDAVSNENKDFVKASHNGYKGIKHTRYFEFDKIKDEFLITDTVNILDNKKHLLFIPFHLHPNVKILKLGTGEFILKYGEVKLGLIADNRLELKEARGQEDPILGWYSPSFMQKEATSVLHGEIEVNKAITLTTKIKIYEY